MKQPTLLLVTLCLTLLCAGAQAARAETPPLIFAAASLTDALHEIAATMEPAPRVSVGGSGTIARQIDQGAPADVVLLANPVWMDWLEARGHVLPETRQEPFGNRLVLVGPPGAAPLPEATEAALLDRLGPDGRMAMGEHRAVPAGQYAFAWLTAKGLWEPLRPRLAETENVRAALALVTRGEAPLGLVYTSDLRAAPEAASPVWEIPAAEQPDIRYAIAAVSPAGVPLVQAFTTPEALAVFARYGFHIPSSE